MYEINRNGAKMSTWIRIIRNLQRNKLRTILYGLAFFLIGNLLLIGIAVYQASDQAVTLTRHKLKPLVSYEINYDAVKDNMYNERIDYFEGKDFTIFDAIEKMANDEMVVAINHLVDIEGYPQSFTAFSLSNDFNPYEGTTITLVGNTKPNMIEFYDRNNTIIDGRFYTSDEIENSESVALINDKLAMLNNLKINDFITIDLIDKSNDRYGHIPEEYRTLTLKIIGIYQVHDDSLNQNDIYKAKSSLYPNQIYLPGSVLAEAKTYIANDSLEVYGLAHPEDMEYITLSTIEDAYNYSSILMLDDPENIDIFCERYSEYTTQYLVLNQNNTAYENLAQPLKTMTYFAKLFMEFIVVVSIVIIGIITAMSLKNRQFEIAMLLASGVTRFKIIFQLLTELMIIIIVSFTLSTISGNFIANRIGNTILGYQKITDVASDYDSYKLALKYFENISSDELLANYQIDINLVTYLQLYGFSILIVVLSTAIPTSFIVMIDPKKIMSN